MTPAPLACTVRACALPLTRTGSTLVCPRGHAFDHVRGGYWNLLQPQDRRSSAPGDADETVRARGRWLARGVADGLTEVLARLVAGSPARVVVDVGCGEGHFARRLFAEGATTVCGVDLSTTAIRTAARAWPEATWVVANADRIVPLLDASCDLALSLFGRRPAGEIRRVLRASGRLVVAVPGADDLIELRRALRGRAEPRERGMRLLDELGSDFRIVTSGRWRNRVHVDRSALEDALSMSYRGARRAERERLAGVTELAVTLATEIVVFEPLPR